MHLETLAPSPPIAEMIERLWLYQGGPPPHAMDRVLPSGREEIIINLTDGELRCYHEDGVLNGRTPGPVVFGLHRSTYLIDTRQQAAIMGVRFRPGGAWRLLGVPAHELQDARVDLRAILGPSSAELMERLILANDARTRLALLDRFLAARRLRDMHPAVAWAAGQIGRFPDSARVAELANEAGLSTRRFSELFSRQVGINPKSFVRLKRFQLTLLQVHAAASPAWSDLALRMGYSDQAHMIREFREFSGMTPAAYHRGRGPMPHLLPLTTTPPSRSRAA